MYFHGYVCNHDHCVLQFIFLVPHILAVTSEPTCASAQVLSVQMRRWSVALQISDARPADRLCSKHRGRQAHAVGEPGQVRARVCANTCSTLLSRRPAVSKSHPRAESALHTRCRPLRSGGRAIGLKDTDTLCVRNIRDLSQKNLEKRRLQKSRFSQFPLKGSNSPWW